ncbi:MAG: ATP-binding cassette domain-containing protein, partial [Magnetococcales bacterium]|nr:ATP-binding cassette domain-containing protein [Magnetococcales bacterium]
GDVLNTQTELPAEQAGKLSLPEIHGHVRFEHVTFRYRSDGPEVLSQLSCDIPAGQVVGIVGPSGSGKSTLTKLVQRLYVPESGRVLVDGMVVDSFFLVGNPLGLHRAGGNFRHGPGADHSHRSVEGHTTPGNRGGQAHPGQGGPKGRSP